MKNYGINLDKELAEQSETDYLFGSTSPKCASNIPENELENYLPKGEVQRGLEDTMDCASRSPLNRLETCLNYLFRNKKLGKNAEWLLENGYVNDSGDIELSDAFIAILSGTTEQGNSLKAPIHAIHEYGCVPKSKLALEPHMTFKDYMNPARVTEELKALGLEFKKRFPVGYDKVYDMGLAEVCTAGYAWPQPINGEYPTNDNTFNHAFWKFKNPKHYIFDNYEESAGDFIKKLAPDYKLFDYGYRVYFTAINEISEASKVNFFQMVWDLLKKLFNRDYRMFGAVRSPKWPTTRRNHLKLHPACEITGSTKDVEVHHRKSFHEFPSLENDPTNLVSLRRDVHLIFGHLGDWSSTNENLDNDIIIWKEKFKNRP